MIKEKELNRILDFMVEVDRLKEIKREGWVLGAVGNPEHVGDHSFSTALLSYLMAEKGGLDSFKCMKMALIHDINEAVAGDIAKRAREEDQVVSNTEKKRIEEKNMSQILSILDPETRAEFRALWNELEDRTTPEAQLVKQCDQFDYVRMLVKYSKRLSGKRVDEFFETGGKSIDLPEIRYMYNRIDEEVRGQKRLSKK